MILKKCILTFIVKAPTFSIIGHFLTDCVTYKDAKNVICPLKTSIA